MSFKKKLVNDGFQPWLDQAIRLVRLLATERVEWSRASPEAVEGRVEGLSEGNLTGEAQTEL
jgi:hypothetical protein